MAGVSQPSPLTPARQRAQALADSGDRAGAVALLEHAVGLGRANLGEDDPDVVAAAHQLARIHQEMDDPANARRVLEEAYAGGHWRLGDSDPLILEISYDLGVVAEELGNRHEARKALGRVVEAGQPVLGDFHWAVVKAKAYLDGDTDAVRAQPTVQQLPPLWEVPVVEEQPPPARRIGLVSEAPAPSPVPPDSRNGPAVFAAIAAVLAAIIAVAALIFVLAERGDGGDSGRSDVPTLGGGPPPADLRVRDFGTSVEVSWSDPGEGKTSFIITGGPPGGVLKPMGEVGPGQTSFRLQGLNDQLDYCFAVLAVYSTTEFASSAQSCTSRPEPTGTG